MKRRFLLWPVTLLLFFLAACDARRFQEDFHHSYDFPSGGRLFAETFNGSVEITGWDRETADISGTKYARSKEACDSIKIDVLPAADSIRVRAVRPSGFRGNLGVRLVIKVPKRTALGRVETSNGGIHVNGVTGHADLETSNGSITVENLSGGLDARTSNGAIRASLSSVEPGRPLQVKTSNGRIDLVLRGWKNTDVEASTRNGGITVRLPEGAGAQLRAQTSNGSITSDFEVSGASRNRNRLEGVIGAGGARLSLTTSNGSIRIESMEAK